MGQGVSFRRRVSGGRSLDALGWTTTARRPAVPAGEGEARLVRGRPLPPRSKLPHALRGGAILWHRLLEVNLDRLADERREALRLGHSKVKMIC